MAFQKESADPCIVFQTAGVLGKRWTIPLVQEIGSNGGFNLLLRRLRKVSPKVLTERLRQLEHIGIVERHAVGKRTNYRLTLRGRELLGIIARLKHWEARHGNPGCGKQSCVDCKWY